MSNANVTRTKRLRESFSFWLEIENPEHFELAKAINQLKRLRQFAPTIRNALMLYLDLQAGKTDELRRQFPFATKPAPSPLDEHFARLEQKILALPLAGAAPRTSSRLPLLLNEPPLEDEPTIQLERISSGKEGWNALISIAALNESYDELPPEILAYGLEIGRIPANRVKPQKSNGGPRKMAVPQFATPTFDDDDLEMDLLA